MFTDELRSELGAQFVGREIHPGRGRLLERFVSSGVVLLCSLCFFAWKSVQQARSITRITELRGSFIPLLQKSPLCSGGLRKTFFWMLRWLDGGWLLDECMHHLLRLSFSKKKLLESSNCTTCFHVGAGHCARVAQSLCALFPYFNHSVCATRTLAKNCSTSRLRFYLIEAFGDCSSLK